MIFKTPWLLVLIPIVLAALFWSRARQKEGSVRFSSVSLLSGIPSTWKIRFAFLPFYFRCAVLTLFIIALAGPRSVLEETVHQAEGIDIVLAIDCSGSMAAEDFELNGRRTNRLDVVKKVVADFVQGRKYDRLGLVAFGGVAYTVCPLTTDYSWLNANLERIQLGLIQDGTAIGSAVNMSLLRLKDSKAKSKVIILLTDGMNNAGKIDPLTAAQAAKALGIKIYTIGAGRRGVVPFPVTDLWGRRFYENVKVEIDEAMLKKAAEMTGGQYFRALDTTSLERIYQEIDALEKTKIEEFGYKEYKELFPGVLVLALLLLVVELVLSNTVLLRIP